MRTNEARTKALDAVRKLSRVATETEVEYLRRLAAYDVQFSAKHEQHEALFARVKALESENAALKTTPPSEGWCDMPTYSYRRAGDVLLCVDYGGNNDGTWWTFMYGGDEGGTDDNGATRKEAKAILDAAVTTKKAEKRYTLADGASGLTNVLSYGVVFVTDLLLEDAERVAAAMNAAEGES